MPAKKSTKKVLNKETKDTEEAIEQIHSDRKSQIDAIDKEMSLAKKNGREKQYEALRRGRDVLMKSR